MKITKSLVVFSLAFSIGLISAPPAHKISAPPEFVNITLPNASEIQAASNTELEVIEENNDWETEDRDNFKIKLIETGEGFHGDEIDAKSGETWLGLFKDKNGGHFLRLTNLKIRRVHDPVVDGYEEKYARSKTGKSVDVSDKIKPLFLLKNAEALRTGKVVTLYRGVTINEIVEYSDEMTSLKSGFLHDYEIGSKKYTLQVKEARNKDSEKILALILEGEGKRQILHTSNAAYSDSLGVLYWSGDLDRDNRPDFYLELYIHENLSNQNLFLSAPAAKETLVKKVADFSTTGC